MAITLTKGQSIDLRKDAPNLKRLYIGLGWNPAKKNPPIDVDASIICIDKNARKDTLVYYGNTDAYSYAITHGGDNLTGDGDGDDEQIKIELDRIPERVEKLSIIINIYLALKRKQHFGEVSGCYVHVDDMDTGRELIQYNISGNYIGKTGIFVADVYRYNGAWKFKAIGEGVVTSNIDEMVAMKCR